MWACLHSQAEWSRLIIGRRKSIVGSNPTRPTTDFKYTATMVPKQPTWYIEAGSDKKLIAGCDQLGVPHVIFKSPPFSGGLPEERQEGSAILYGATSVMLAAKASPVWQDGVWYDPDSFKPSAYLKHYGDHFLSSDAKFLTIEQFAAEDHPDDYEFFIKPDDDLKQLCGQPMDFEEFKRWYTGFAGIYDTMLNAATQIMVSGLKEIDNEYRFVVKEGKVIASSAYRPKVSTDVPRIVRHAAEYWAELWSPADVFVMDVAKCGEAVYVIECNCFNASGLYACDIPKILKSFL